jgi:hypothetical protein
MTIRSPIAKFIALSLVSVVAALVTMSADGSILAKVNSMSPAEYVEYQRKLYHHSFVHHYLIWLIIGGLYIASVEFIAYAIGLCCKKKNV